MDTKRSCIQPGPQEALVQLLIYMPAEGQAEDKQEGQVDMQTDDSTMGCGAQWAQPAFSIGINCVPINALMYSVPSRGHRGTCSVAWHCSRHPGLHFLLKALLPPSGHIWEGQCGVPGSHGSGSQFCLAALCPVRPS